MAGEVNQELKIKRVRMVSATQFPEDPKNLKNFFLE
jgi:hypothetical protein